MSQVPLIFIIAGEASSDQLGADLMISLKKLAEVRFAGIGGEAMEAQGFQSLFPIQELSLMGLSGIIANFPKLLERLKSTVKTIKAMKPAVVVTIDTQEFSIRVMKRLQGLPQRPRLIHYGAPTVWAWRPWRARSISRILDRLLCLYPFEPPYFEKYGLKATFVGHPIAKQKFIEKEREPHLLCVLPGSRWSEVKVLLPIFGQAAGLVKKEVPDLKIIIPTLPHLKSMVEEGTKDWPCEVEILLGDQGRNTAFQTASVALGKSGTVALQLAAARLPFAIAYKIGKFQGWLARKLILTPWACMVNILLAFEKLGPNFVLSPPAYKLVPEPWIPEFIQENCTAENLAHAILKLMSDQKVRQQQIQAMTEVTSLLKAPTDAAAKAVLEEISKVA
ncbi:MAG: lipid-A-disaccharide synthase [Alphaproteobacteria bacterium]|nr:lipid-A-disaccharide synthase [Alphaproteobacteria bacterium]